MGSTKSDMFMEYVEEEAIDTAPPDMKPKIGCWYIDDSFEVVCSDKQDKLTEHLNTMYNTGSIKFTDDLEKDGSIPFLDAVISQKHDWGVKVQVYRKKTHTDQ